MGKFGVPKNEMGFMACYLFMWGLFTFFMWIGTWKANRALQTVFLSLTILFWMLAARDAFGLSGTFAVVTGYEGIFCGIRPFTLPWLRSSTRTLKEWSLLPLEPKIVLEYPAIMRELPVKAEL